VNILLSDSLEEVLYEVAYAMGVTENFVVTQFLPLLSNVFSVFEEGFRGFVAGCSAPLIEFLGEFLGVQQFKFRVS